MSCVEYHLLLILICLVKSGISQDLGKNYELGFLKQNLNKILAPLLRIELEFKIDIQIKKRVANLMQFLNFSYFSFYTS